MSEIDSIGTRIEKVVAGLEDLTTLIGEVKNEPVKLKNGNTLVPGLGMSAETKIIQSRGQDLRKGIFNVLVIGTFNNGKSTFLNAILGDNVLIAKAAPATAIITKLVYGTDPMVKVYRVGEPEPQKLSVSEFQEKFALTPEDMVTIGQTAILDRFKDIEYAEVECLLPYCENGVRFIDSPGLAESVSRTRVSNSYFPQAHAIIFVLNADQILNFDEKTFIEENIRNKDINNVFFIVNKFDLLRKMSDRTEITQLVHKFLFPLFNNEEFYDKRVYFVSGEDALIARTEGTSVDKDLLEKSKIPAFERELEKYLTSEERVKAGFSTTIETVNSVVTTANKSIQDKFSSLDQPLEKLKKNRKETEKKLIELEEGVQRKKELISLYGGIISSKIISNLDAYIVNLLTNWDTDAPQIMDLSDIGYKTAMLSSFSENSKKQLTMAIERELNKYLKAKFEEWSSSELQVVINPVLGEMEDRLNQEIEDFSLQLTEIENIFSGKPIVEGFETESGKAKVTKVGQAIGGLVLLDPSQITGSLMGDGSWSKFLGRFILDTIVSVISFSFLGPLGLVAYIVAEILHAKHSHKDFGARVISGIGVKLREELPKQVRQEEPTLTGTIQAKFSDLGDELTETLQDKIDDVREEQDRIISLIQKQSSVISQEKNRLKLIQENIKQVTENIKSFV